SAMNLSKITAIQTVRMSFQKGLLSVSEGIFAKLATAGITQQNAIVLAQRSCRAGFMRNTGYAVASYVACWSGQTKLRICSHSILAIGCQITERFAAGLGLVSKGATVRIIATGCDYARIQIIIPTLESKRPLDLMVFPVEEKQVAVSPFDIFDHVAGFIFAL